MRDNVIAQHFRAGIHIELVWPAGAEVPAFTAIADELATGWKKWADLGHSIGCLVQLKQRRTSPSSGTAESKDNPHAIAALVRVGVAPIGVTDIVHAILAAAIRGIRDADGLGIVGGGKGESTACRGDEGLNLGGRISRARKGSLFFHPAARKQAGCLSNNCCSSGQYQKRHRDSGTERRQASSDEQHDLPPPGDRTVFVLQETVASSAELSVKIGKYSVNEREELDEEMVNKGQIRIYIRGRCKRRFVQSTTIIQTVADAAL